jgi:uncharacterized membrane protein YedE/YeeE
MNTNEYLTAIGGGALIGLSSVLLLWLNGRIAGISGIVNGLFRTRWADAGWRLAFVAGLIAGGLFYHVLSGEALMSRTDYPLALTIIAGLLVGFGTRLGGGCTSGHGVCGVGRLSIRSIVATVLFVLIGMATATILSSAIL